MSAGCDLSAQQVDPGRENAHNTNWNSVKPDLASQGFMETHGRSLSAGCPLLTGATGLVVLRPPVEDQGPESIGPDWLMLSPVPGVSRCILQRMGAIAPWQWSRQSGASWPTELGAGTFGLLRHSECHTLTAAGIAALLKAGGWVVDKSYQKSPADGGLGRRIFPMGT